MMPWEINKGLCKNAYHTIIWIFKIDIWMNPASPDRLQEDKDSNSTVDYNSNVHECEKFNWQK